LRPPSSTLFPYTTLFRSTGRATALATTVAFLIATLSGCFNTYRVQQDEFAKLQTAEEVPRTVTSVSGDQVVVDRETPLYVRSVRSEEHTSELQSRENLVC